MGNMEPAVMGKPAFAPDGSYFKDDHGAETPAAVAALVPSAAAPAVQSLAAGTPQGEAAIAPGTAVAAVPRTGTASPATTAPGIAAAPIAGIPASPAAVPAAPEQEPAAQMQIPPAAQTPQIAAPAAYGEAAPLPAIIPQGPGGAAAQMPQPQPVPQEPMTAMPAAAVPQAGNPHAAYPSAGTPPAVPVQQMMPQQTVPHPAAQQLIAQGYAAPFPARQSQHMPPHEAAEPRPVLGKAAITPDGRLNIAGEGGTSSAPVRMTGLAVPQREEIKFNFCGLFSAFALILGIGINQVADTNGLNAILFPAALVLGIIGWRQANRGAGLKVISVLSTVISGLITALIIVLFIAGAALLGVMAAEMASIASTLGI